MINMKRTLTSFTKQIALFVLIMLLAFTVGCAEITPENTENSPWVPASSEIKQSLGVSTWYVESLDNGTTRVVGYDQSDIQLSELMISTPVLDQVKTLTYELYVTNHTRLVLTKDAVIENTLSVEPRGQEWFDAMVGVPSLVRTGSTANKSIVNCVAANASQEIISILCDISNGSYGNPGDYVALCKAIYDCVATDYNSDTRIASSNTGSSQYSDSWSSNYNSNSGCYDSWGYEIPCQNNSSSQNNTCYDSWGYPVSCEIW